MGAIVQSLLANLEEKFLVFIESVPDAMVLSGSARWADRPPKTATTERLFRV